MPVLTLDNINFLPNSFAVYRIFANTPENTPIVINRFAAADINGLLYIGRTTKQNLKTRIYQFYATSRFNYTTHNHNAALKYKVNNAIQQALGNHVLFFDYEICDNPEIKENELLEAYASVHGEYPPLNK
jgi:hypothetical protein